MCIPLTATCKCLNFVYSWIVVTGSSSERLAVFNAVKDYARAQQLYDFPSTDKYDVDFDLVEIDTIPYGDSFDVTVNVEVSFYLIIDVYSAEEKYKYLQ